jgi:hypothetical protein
MALPRYITPTRTPEVELHLPWSSIERDWIIILCISRVNPQEWGYGSLTSGANFENDLQIGLISHILKNKKRIDILSKTFV